MSGETILVDSNYICYRALYSDVGKLSHNDRTVGTIYGYLSTIAKASSYNSTSDFVHIFDSKASLRREIFPEYKIGRRKKKEERTPEEQQAMRDCNYQVDLLYNEILPQIGFSNVLKFQGYEGDDIFGSILKNPDYEDEKFIMYASDGDLYQLLRKNVRMYSPSSKKTTDLLSFRTKYSVYPREWPMVKAIGGCVSDCVPGCMPGIAEGRAIKYINDVLSVNSVFYERIVSDEGKANTERNLKLVKLPFEGTPNIELYEDSLSWDGLVKVYEKYGLLSMLDESSLEGIAWKEMIAGGK